MLWIANKWELKVKTWDKMFLCNSCFTQTPTPVYLQKYWPNVNQPYKLVNYSSELTLTRCPLGHQIVECGKAAFLRHTVEPRFNEVAGAGQISLLNRGFVISKTSI